MDWSFELLATADRALLAGLSIFAGRFSLRAVAETCVEGDSEAALASLERLVDASLVTTAEWGGMTRYALLETVRQYAASHLDGAEAARAKHASYYASLAEEAEPELTGPEQARWFEILDAEHDNLRAALSSLEAQGEHEGLLQMSAALMRFWYVRGYLVDARFWLDRALRTSEPMPAQLRRRALTAAAAVALLQGDYEYAVSYAEASLGVARETSEPRLVANGLSNLGAIVLAAGDYGRAGELLDDAVALARSVGDERILALALNNRGDHALTVGDHVNARPLFEESLALLRARDDTANVARSLFNLACVALVDRRAGDARELLEESLALSRRAGDREDLAWGVLGLAALAATTGDGERAALLLGASSSLLDAMGAAFKPFERQLHERTEGRAKDLLGEPAFSRARERGATLSEEQVMSLVAGG